MASRTDTQRSLPDRQLLGARIRDARNQLGMNQRDFATIAGFRQCSVSYIENATRDVLASTLVDAAATVGLEVALVREYHLPLLDLTAAEVEALLAGARVIAAADRRPLLLSALDKLTTSTEEADRG